VIGHQQISVAGFFVHLNRLDEIDVALVGEHFHEIVAVSANVAEVYVEDFAARSEIADHVEDLPAGVGRHVGNRALAEVQAVIRTLLDGDELLETGGEQRLVTPRTVDIQVRRYANRSKDSPRMPVISSPFADSDIASKSRRNAQKLTLRGSSRRGTDP
jgi:hypothetical protein